MEANGEVPASIAARQFNTTHWSVIIKAGGNQTTQGQSALTELCKLYWYPLYAYVRRQGRSEHDAQDLTQAFFESLLRRNDLKMLSPTKGRFRTWLLSSMKHFLINDWKKSNRIRRGRDFSIISLDAELAQERYKNEPVDNMTADRIYDRRWALTLLEAAMETLASEYKINGKFKLFELLKPALSGSDKTRRYADIGKLAGLSEAGVKTAVFRLRKRYQTLIRETVMETVDSPSTADDELQCLMSSLS